MLNANTVNAAALVNACVNRAFYLAGQIGVVPIASGMPGVGKTAGVTALARATGRLFHNVLLDQCLPEDLGGFPVVRQRTAPDGRVYDAMCKILDERFLACHLEPSALLVDEITNCPHTTQASALQMIQEGIPGCWIFACCNPIEQAAAGVDLTPPFVNRCCLLEFETDRQAIAAGWRNGLHFPAPVVPIVPDAWTEFVPQWGELAAAYVDHFPDTLEAFPRDPAQASRPFPSPRSWTNLIKLCAANAATGDDAGTRAQLAHGTIGSAHAGQFLQWVDEQGLPDPEFLLAYPDRLVLPRRGDLATAVLRSVAARVAVDRTGDRWERLADLTEKAYSQSQESAAAFVGKVWSLKPEGYAPRNRNGLWKELNQLLAATA